MSTNKSTNNVKKINTNPIEFTQNYSNEKEIFKSKVNNKNVVFKGSNLKNILKTIKNGAAPKNKNVPSLTHFLKFNAMYFSNNESRRAYTQKFYEVYTSFLMMLETVTHIKTFLNEYKNLRNEEEDLYKDIQIRENINMRTTVFNKEDVDKILFETSVVSLFGSSSTLEKNIRNTFNKYKYQRGLMTLSDNDISNITLFETLFIRYNKSERLAKIIPRLIKQYNMFKSKIFDRLCDNAYGTFDFGLLGYGFLFAYDYFPDINPDEETKAFFNKKLYDMATKNIDIDKEINNLVDANKNIGFKLVSLMNYFYNNSYRDANFFETLINALDMDLYGLKFALFYIHSKYLKLFLKRKFKIDKQIYNYLSSYDIKTEAVDEFKDYDPTNQFINPDSTKTFFNDYDTFITK